MAANQNLTDQEVYALIFEAGFSTAEAVTNISGRGVGMDVVRRNIEALRGMVEIDSEQGVGTTIRIRLPLTLAIIDGFLMGVGSASYVVPLDMVMECIELSEAERQETRDSNYINLRGEVLPFIRLREHFREQGKAGRRENIVVVQYAGQKAGLVVDELMGEFQTVIKPLGKIVRQSQGHQRLDHPRQRRSGADPGCAGADPARGEYGNAGRLGRKRQRSGQVS